MKILRIELENFASHLHSEIDLAEVVSATVSGKNGSGKSTAFVDAPLWALFGKCRAEPDTMMSHDQLRMSVTIDFSLDGQVYRVQRTRSKQTKAGKTELSFMAVNDGVYTPIGGHKVTETQEAIKSVLNADYELCANSNFLIQGKADKFSTAGAAERKAILAQVLKLDEYATLRTLANRKVQITAEQISGVESQLVPMQALANSLITINEQIKSAEIDLAQCSVEQLGMEKQLKTHHEDKGKKQAALNAILEEKQGLTVLFQERDELSIKIERNKLDQEYYKTLTEKKDDILAKAKLHEALTSAFEVKRLLETGITEALLKFEKEINQAIERKAREDSTLLRVESELQGLEHKKELIESQKNVELGKLSNAIGQDIQAGNLLQIVPCWEELQKKCRFTIEAVQAMAGLQVKKDQLTILEQRNFVREQLPDYEKDYETRLEQIKKLKITDTDEKLGILKEKRQEVVLDKGVITKVLTEMQDEMRAIYPTAKLKPELESVLKEVEKLTELRTSYDDNLHRVNNQITIKMLKAEEENGLAKWLTESFDIEDKLQNKITFYKGEMQGITERLGSHRQSKTHSEDAQVSVKELTQGIADTQNRNTAFKQLAQYYTTIPIMIMEGAVPTLEAATNSILEKISPSGMRIRLETQKALKSSDKIGETLDILVRDVFGEKPYENYSGGEKFRLDLALRFGLSQLLMHRAGSRMETLIIDEGLGSLDGDGLALLRECLSKLETSFGLILVISHVEEIQGTFEQQIMVEKNAIGSEIKVL
jgi:exonuclease SbcC